jgi:uncharacterized protein with predicted RNA binding PUA domain
VSTEFSSSSALKRVRTIADFQFGSGVGAVLVPDEAEFRYSSTGRIRYILLSGERIATLRAQDGRLTLSLRGAELLSQAVAPPRYRVYIQTDVTPFVAKGKNAMAKHVTSADPAICAGEEVLVVTEDNTLVATGTAVISGEEMLAFNYGVAVNVRKGTE